MLELETRLRSHEIFSRAQKVTPGGVNSPVRSFPGMDMTPLIVAEGDKDEIIDVDGNRYVDFCQSWGALLHGHAHPQIVSAIQAQSLKGTTYGMTAPSEEALARLIVDLVPGIDMIRFVSSGSEATNASLRLARGVTKKRWIVKFDGNYHGSVDALLVKAGSGVAHMNREATSQGITESSIERTLSLEYNNIQALEDLFQNSSLKDDIAAVIVEPIAANMGVVPASRAFLTQLRQWTQKQGSLLIFDEVVTGFRVGLGGAQELYGIDPDITCLGKIMGGGLPAAGLGGKSWIMKELAPLGQVYQAGTLSGNPLAMVAGKQALLMAQQTSCYADLEEMGHQLIAPLQEHILKKGYKMCIQRIGSMFTPFFGLSRVDNVAHAKQNDELLYREFFKFALERGFFGPPSPYEAWFLSTVHTSWHLQQFQEMFFSFLETYRDRLS